MKKYLLLYILSFININSTFEEVVGCGIAWLRLPGFLIGSTVKAIAQLNPKMPNIYIKNISYDAFLQKHKISWDEFLNSLSDQNKNEFLEFYQKELSLVIDKELHSILEDMIVFDRVLDFSLTLLKKNKPLINDYILEQKAKLRQLNDYIENLQNNYEHDKQLLMGQLNKRNEKGPNFHLVNSADETVFFYDEYNLYTEAYLDGYIYQTEETKKHILSILMESYNKQTKMDIKLKNSFEEKKALEKRIDEIVLFYQKFYTTNQFAKKNVLPDCYKVLLDEEWKKENNKYQNLKNKRDLYKQNGKIVKMREVNTEMQVPLNRCNDYKKVKVNSLVNQLYDCYNN